MPAKAVINKIELLKGQSQPAPIGDNFLKSAKTVGPVPIGLLALIAA